MTGDERGGGSGPRGESLRDQFLSGMAHAASTVSVVTTDGPAGRAGVTVSAMTSVSVDTRKPTLLACVHHLSPAAPRILENRVFCVNLLRSDQAHISDIFAGRRAAPGGDKFACANWTMETTGSPRIIDPLVAFDCHVIRSERVGTHHVIIGEVDSVFMATAGSPLVYAHRTYGRTTVIETPTEDDTSPGVDGPYHLRSLRIGCFHTFGPYVVPELIAGMQTGPGFELVLLEGDQVKVLQGLGAGEIDIALIYGFDIGDEFSVETLAKLQPHVLLAKDSGLAKRDSLTLAELAREPMVLLEAPPSSGYFLSLFTGRGLEPRVRFRIASFEMVRGLVGRGFGYSLLSTRPASDLSYDGRPLVSRPLADPVPGSPVVLVRRRNDPPSATTEDFARLCRHYFARGSAISD
ncbi:MAG: LysR substrate-binding domain-containing protein [Paracoccaceae bacterium]|nr:LysR substrate-binding domain-containing protein [Paracoccaceae bacterium]